VAGGYDQELRTINPLSGAEEREAKESQGVVNCIAEVGKGVTAVGLDNGQIRFWDVEGWACKKTLREHKKGVTDLKVDAKGLLLVSSAGR
jgi:WD40 repeat protein